jgi:hypothetical protein
VQFCETEPAAPGPPSREWRPRGELVRAPRAQMAKRGKAAPTPHIKKRVRKKSPNPVTVAIGADHFDAEKDWPVSQAEYEALAPGSQVHCLACHGVDRSFIKFQVQKVVGIATQGGFLEVKCINDGGLSQASLDLVGVGGRGVMHMCKQSAEKCKATWGNRQVFHFSKWRVLKSAEYGTVEDELFGDTGSTGGAPAPAPIFGQPPALGAAGSGALGGGEPRSGTADPDLLRAKLESLRASLGGSLPEAPAQAGLPAPTFPPEPPYPRGSAPASRDGGRAAGSLNELLYARAAERVRGTAASSSTRPLSGGLPGPQGSGGNSSSVAAALSGLVSALESAETGAAEPEASGSVFRDAPSRAVQDLDVYARSHPGALLESSLAEMRKYVSSREGATDQSGNAKVLNYLQTVFCQRFPGDVVGLRTSREMRTLAEALDTLLEGNLPRLGDILIQRFKALESSVVDGGWALARHQELIPSADAGLASVAERSLAARLEMQRQRLIEGAAKTKEAAKAKEKGSGATSSGSRQ